MFTLPTLRQENRIKRLDLSQLSFRTVSPRDLLSPTKTPSEKDSHMSKSAVPFERSQTTASTTTPQAKQTSFALNNRSHSLDAGSLALTPVVKYEPSKFRPAAPQDDSLPDDDSSKYTLHTSGIEKPTRKQKNLSMSIQSGKHSKELVNPQMFGIKGSEIKKKRTNKHRKLVTHSLSIKSPAEMTPKGDNKYLAKLFDSPKKPNTPNMTSYSYRETYNSQRETSMGSKNVTKLLGLHTKIFSARNTERIKKLLTEDDETEVEGNGSKKGYLNPQEYYNEMENEEKGKVFQKVSTDLQCFLETKTAYKESLVNPPQYSLCQTFTKNRNTRHFRMTSVDNIKEFCKGMPVRLSKAH